MYQDELEAIADPQERENKFIEFNVMEQVYDLSKTSIIQNAWEKRGAPFLHGWVYSLETGIINDLKVSFNDNSELPQFYKFEAPAAK